MTPPKMEPDISQIKLLTGDGLSIVLGKNKGLGGKMKWLVLPYKQ